MQFERNAAEWDFDGKNAAVNFGGTGVWKLQKNCKRGFWALHFITIPMQSL